MQDQILVFGHKNPDADAIVSAMAYASLMNSLGNGSYLACRLGHINDQTDFLLRRFELDPPVYLHSVRTQISDIEFDHPPVLYRQVPVSHAWEVLHQNGVTGSAIPIANEDGTLFGMLTAGAIAEHDMDSIDLPCAKDVPIFNLLSALEGRIINDSSDFFESISGDVVIALPQPNPLPLREGSVVICGQQEDVVQQALEAKASCIILCQTDLAEKYSGIHSDTCVIASPCDAYRAVRMLYQANPVERIAQHSDLVSFHLDDYLDDVRDKVLESRYRSYPVLDENGKPVGTLSRYHLLRPRVKRVVLVDHNEKSQSVAGLEQAQIIAILDHHRLGDVQTGYPTFMRNEPIGSTTSIVALMYQEHGLMPGPKLAGLMAGAILSDTVIFKSPTCTEKDRRLAERLARIAGIDLESLGREMFSLGGSDDKPVSEQLKSDFKEFRLGNHMLGIGQITTIDISSRLSRMDEYLAAMESMRKEHAYDMVILMLTDVLREGTELIYTNGQDSIRQAFGIDSAEEHHVFLEHVVSRKKQIVPALSALWG